MWAHVAFVLVTAANLASHVVIPATADYLLITAQLVSTGVLHQGRAVLLKKAPHTFVFAGRAVCQILGLVAFQSTLFTVIFSAAAYITLQSRHWMRKRETKTTHSKHFDTEMSILLLIYSSLIFVHVSIDLWLRQVLFVLLLCTWRNETSPGGSSSAWV